MTLRTITWRLVRAGLSGVVLAAPLASQAGSAQAVAMGCYNCHGQPLRADAPSFERLAAEFEKRRGDAAAEQHAFDEFRHAGVPLHERVSSESARQADPLAVRRREIGPSRFWGRPQRSWPCIRQHDHHVLELPEQ